MGQTVAGLPTQFLMERAFAQQELDWRAITVEVNASQFEQAVDGMTAMNFMALRMYPSLEKQAGKRFFSETSLESFIGHATSAAMTLEGWEAWNHLGHAILQLLSQRTNLSESILWLDGDSSRTRSLLACLCSGEMLPLSVLWTRPPELAPDAMPAVIRELTLETAQPRLDLLGPHSTADERLGQLLAEPSESPLNNLILVAEAWEPHRLATLCESLQGHSFHAKFLVGQVESMEFQDFQLIDQAEIAVAAEAYDFQRWTGLTADIALLRDAYDEYCDF